MRNKNVFSISIILILISIFSQTVLSLGEYPWVGGEDYDYSQGRGFFSSTTPYVAYPAPVLTQPRMSPIIEDLDGDGINEIIVIDRYGVNLYNSKTLTLLDGINLPADDTFSNLIAFDIDADGIKELIIARESAEAIDILNWNGSFFSIQATLDYSALANSNDGETIIGCKSTNRCLLAYIENDNSLGGSVADDISVVGFTSTGFGDPLLIASTGATPPQVFCMPRIKSMPLDDYDRDGETEYIFSYVLGHTTAAEKYYISYIWVNASNSVFHEQTIIEAMDNIFDDTSIQCNESDPSKSDVGNFVTSPLVFDINGKSSDGLETVLGVQLDDDEFEMHSWRSSGSVLDIYPILLNAEGIIISNVIKTNIDPDSPGAVDFCVMGYRDDKNIINLLCASEQGSGIFDPETDEFEFDTSEYYNISKNFSFYNNMIHSVQHSNEHTSGEDLNEILSPYGIFKIDYEGNNELLLQFENPLGDGVVLSSDVEQIGRDDLIVLTSTNLWYIDDGYSKSPGEIDEVSSTPCFNSTWKINTSVGITIKVVDPDGDLVSARAVLYEGETFEQDSGWTVNSTSGTSFPLLFTANESVGNAILKVYGKDDDFITQEDTLSFTISVGPDGLEFGDCQSIIDVTTTIEEALEIEELPEENESIQTGVSTIKENLGLNVTDFVLWLLIMVVVTGSILWGATKEKWDPKIALTGVAIFNIIMLILGVAEGFISPALIFIFGIFILGICVTIYRKAIFGGG